MNLYLSAWSDPNFFFKEEGSDYDLSSAHFLGLDMAKLVGRATNAKLCDILEREAASTRGHQLAMDVLRQSAFQKESYERIVVYFDALRRGLVDCGFSMKNEV